MRARLIASDLKIFNLSGFNAVGDRSEYPVEVSLHFLEGTKRGKFSRANQGTGCSGIDRQVSSASIQLAGSENMVLRSLQFHRRKTKFQERARNGRNLTGTQRPSRRCDRND